MLILNGVRTITISKSDNLALIKFQFECRFSFVKVFFKTNRNALQNLQEYKQEIPRNHYLVHVLDENLNHDVFCDLYLTTYRSGADIIAFLGHQPKPHNDKHKRNFSFIASRDNDSILRLVSFIKKLHGGIVSSLVYHLFEFDVYSFIIHFGSPNIDLIRLEVLDTFRYVILSRGTDIDVLLLIIISIKLQKNLPSQNVLPYRSQFIT